MTDSMDDPKTEFYSSLTQQEETLLSRYTYSIFIALVAVFSLIVSMAYYLLPLPEPVSEVLRIVDSLNALILLFDFLQRFRRSPNKFKYMFPRGVMDLLGSLPFFPVLRFFRVFQIFHITRHLSHTTPKEVQLAARKGLAESTLLVVVAVGLLVVTLGSIAIVIVEAYSPNANIRTGSDAVWWALVTIATVGYGDRYPVTNPGRLIGVMMIVLGVSIFSVLTSFIASVFMANRNRAINNDGVHNEVAALRAEIAALRQLLERDADNQPR